MDVLWPEAAVPAVLWVLASAWLVRFFGWALGPFSRASGPERVLFWLVRVVAVAIAGVAVGVL